MFLHRHVSSTAPADSRRQRRIRLHVFYAAAITAIALLAGYRGVLPVFRSHLKAYLDIGDAGFGLLFSAGHLPGLVSILLGGQLVDRWGPRRVIRIGLVGLGCAMLVVAFGGQRLWAFMLAVAIAGTFNGPLFIAISAYLGKLFPRNQRQVLSLNLASTSVGGMMFPMVAESLLALAERSGTIHFAHVLHLPFLVVGTLLVGLSFVYRKPRAATAAQTAPAGKGRRWQWRDLMLPLRAFWLALFITLHGVSDSILHVWMARFLESASFAAQSIRPGIVLSGYALAYLLARGFLALLPERWGRRGLMVVPGLLGGGILIAGLLSRNYLLTAAGYVVGGLCWSCEFPAIVSTLLRHDRRRFGAAMAMAGMMTAIAMFISMNAMGLLVDRIGESRMWMTMLLPAAGFMLVGIGASIWLRVYGNVCHIDTGRIDAT